MVTEVKTTHTCNNGNGPVFGRKTQGCPRCDELMAGAAPRSWGNQEVKEYNFRAGIAYRASPVCVGHAPQLNPGGYCNVCGKGRDFS
jgi:hypothetical protein